MIRRRLLAVFAALALGAVGQSAQANFTGSLAFGTSTTALNATTLLATQYAFAAPGANTMLVTGSTGAFQTAGVTPFSTTYSTGTLNLMSLVGFQLTNGTFGTFTAGAGSFVIDQSATELDVFLLGTYSGLPGNTSATPASVLLSFNQVGGPGTAIGSGISLSVPPASVVPEPASIALLGIGFVSVGGFALRRRTAK
jgi:hypothetical protein